MAELDPKTGRQRRGFAAMDPVKRKEIAARGGGSVPAEKRSFSKDRALAASAGKAGGEASHGKRKRKKLTGAHLG
jgi:general stress protein YciG